MALATRSGLAAVDFGAWVLRRHVDRKNETGDPSHEMRSRDARLRHLFEHQSRAHLARRRHRARIDRNPRRLGGIRRRRTLVAGRPKAGDEGARDPLELGVRGAVSLRKRYAWRACLHLCARQGIGLAHSVAEREGFEPPSPCGLTVFKTAAFDRSANSPGLEKTLYWPHFSLRKVPGSLQLGGALVVLVVT